jgi:tetratricopeptide (TPR) repeat protein/transcriptional regulator with XRE-family HTH domain
MNWHSESFAQLLRRLRTEAGLTQDDLAAAAGISTRSVSDLERGVNLTARKDTARLLAEALGLVGGERIGFESAARGRSGAGSVAAVTRALPRDVGSFVGRDSELSQLEDLAHYDGDAVRVCVIGGMAGVGKTAFAVHAAHLLARSFPHGQIFLPLQAHTPGQHPVDPSDALASLLQTMGVRAPQIPADQNARAGLWRDVSADKRLLMVLDDASDSEQIRPVLPGSGGSLVLVTSRRHLTALEDAWTIDLDALPADQATQLLTRLAARSGLNDDDPAIADVARLCGYLPLAIGMMGRQLHHHPAWTASGLATELAAARDRLALMHTEDLSIAAAFDLSYRELDRDQQQLFRRLGLHPGTEIDGYAAAALDGSDLATARSNLGALYDHYLLTEPAPGRYSFHDLVGDYARKLAEQDDAAERDLALGRLLEFYRHGAQAASRHLARQQATPGSPGDEGESGVAFADRDAALEWLKTERTNLHSAARCAADCGRFSHATTIAASMREFLRSQGYWSQALALHSAALDAAHAAGNQVAEARALADLADIQFLTDDYPAASASFDRALALYRNVGDRAGEAGVLSSQGELYQAVGDYDTAVASLTKALELWRGLDNRQGEADTLTRLGTARYLTGSPAAAAATLNEALQLYQQADDAHGEADALTSLGTVQYLAQDYAAAAASQTRALELYRRVGNRLGQANALTDLAAVQSVTGDIKGAMDSLHDALRLFRDLGDRSGEAEALNNLGETTRQTVPADARAYHEQALALARTIAAPREEARALEGIGKADISTGDHGQGATALRDALAIYRRIGSPYADELQQFCDAH